MAEANFIIRDASTDEFSVIGELLIDVYSHLDGFPKPSELPQYYQMLRNIGELTRTSGTELLVAVSPTGKLLGGVVYFADIAEYGASIPGFNEKNSSGFRLLGVALNARGRGIGRSLVNECISRARSKFHDQVIIHTTKAMHVAWGMYEAMGFVRSDDLDFAVGPVQVFGFRLNLRDPNFLK